MKEKGSMRKLRLISKFMMSSIGKLIVTIPILPNTSEVRQSDSDIWSVNKTQHEKYFI